MTRILFLHGRESGPHGTKARWLAERYGAVTPQLETVLVPDTMPAARAAVAEHTPDLIVASSYGGAVAVKLLLESAYSGPVVLIAPAATKLGGDHALPDGARVIIIHGDGDAVVPYADSVALAASGGPGVRLVTVVGGDHQLHAILENGVLASAIAELRG